MPKISIKEAEGQLAAHRRKIDNNRATIAAIQSLPPDATTLEKLSRQEKLTYNQKILAAHQRKAQELEAYLKANMTFFARHMPMFQKCTIALAVFSELLTLGFLFWDITTKKKRQSLM